MRCSDSICELYAESTIIDVMGGEEVQPGVAEEAIIVESSREMLAGVKDQDRGEECEGEHGC
jgi:hypothetical protein